LKNLGTISNICYKWTNVMSSIQSLSWGFDYRLESLDLWLESPVLGSRARFLCLFYSLAIFRCFLLVEREGLALKVWSFRVESTFVCLLSSPVIFWHFLLIEKEGLNLGYWSLRSRASSCASSLHLGSLGVFLSLLEDEVLILKVFLLKRESLVLRRIFHLGVILFSLRMTFSPW